MGFSTTCCEIYCFNLHLHLHYPLLKLKAALNNLLAETWMMLIIMDQGRIHPTQLAMKHQSQTLVIVESLKMRLVRDLRNWTMPPGILFHSRIKLTTKLLILILKLVNLLKRIYNSGRILRSLEII